MPTKQLPDRPNLDHLKQQAQDLLTGCGAGDPLACQRLREFHPWFAGLSDAIIAESRLTWSDGLFAIAREYGFASWPRLKSRVASAQPGEADRSLRDRIEDRVLQSAVDAVDDGDIEALRRLIAADPDLPRRRAHFEGQNYFLTPSLLAFVAENPVRNDSLPPNIVEIARLVLDSGGASNVADVNETLALAASGRVVREAGSQRELLELLLRYGADPERAIDPALVHGEFQAVEALLEGGARKTLRVAAALGDLEGATHLLAGSNATERHFAFAYAAQHGRAPVLSLLLEAGEDPNRYNPPGSHSHSTALHQAVWYGHEAAVRVLLEHGARTDLKDALWQGTPLDWAVHAGRDSMVDLLTSGGTGR